MPGLIRRVGVAEIGTDEGHQAAPRAEQDQQHAADSAAASRDPCHPSHSAHLLCTRPSADWAGSLLAAGTDVGTSVLTLSTAARCCSPLSLPKIAKNAAIPASSPIAYHANTLVPGANRPVTAAPPTALTTAARTEIAAFTMVRTSSR